MSGSCIIELRSFVSSLLLCSATSPPLSSLQWCGESKEGTPVPAPHSMAQAGAPGGRGLPCSPKQALALYQHLFRCPAGLGQLQAALRQVQNGRACPSGLELLTVLLEMERSRRAQEQMQEVHPRQPLHSCRGQAADPSSVPDPSEARSDGGRRWENAGMPAEPTPGCLPELNPTSSSSFGEPESSEFKDLDQKKERGQAEPTTQRPLPPSSGNLQGRKVAQEAWGSSGLPSQGLPEHQDPRKGLAWSLGQDRAELQKLPRTAIPQSQREKTIQGQSGETTQALREVVSGGPGWETPQGENKNALQSHRGNCPECQRKEALLEPSEETSQGGEVKILQFSGGGSQDSQAREVAQGETPTQPQEEGDSLGILGDFCRSPGEQMPQPRQRERPGPGEKSTRLMQDKTDGQRQESALAVGEQGAGLEGAPALIPSARPPAPPLLPVPGAVMLAALITGDSEQQERPTALPGHPGMVRNQHRLRDPGGDPGPAVQQVLEARGPRAGDSARLLDAHGERKGAAEAPKASKGAWLRPPGREASVGVSAAQQETTLQRLLELHSAARRRRRQDCEQQRLRARPPHRAGQLADGATRAASRQLTAVSLRSWNVLASSGTATAGCTPWGPHPARLSSHHRPDLRERLVGALGQAGCVLVPFQVCAPRTCADTDRELGGG
ncbi:glutenin, high molecular weight subunit DX5-like isoform X3 [Pteropus medius]|uniref:glutenin, high molecular weight subunit DX5-like isoform X3 n=1 Tax=Pteropus vampyrus TaxID=132908 RepID=UPI00196AE799|nr:glutenin, high molecular weight subunit DX5-like isoform X3 [Pteropus giganteus]